MSIQRIPITTFQMGELSEKLSCRFDLPVYGQGASILENWMPFSQGGVTLRPGTIQVGTTKNNEKAMLVAFIISDVVSYILEFVNLYIRVWRNDGLVIEINTPYSQSQLLELQFCQIANSLVIVHRQHPVKDLKQTGIGIFNFADFAFDGKQWTAATAYVDGDIVYNAGNLYYCLIAGTSGSTAPTGTSESIKENTVTWRWLQTSPFRTTGNYPGCISYFNGRLWMASTINEPKVVWASKPFEYGNFLKFEVVGYKNRQIKDPENYYFRATANTGTTLSTSQDPRTFAQVGQYLCGPETGTEGEDYVRYVPALTKITEVGINYIIVSNPDNLPLILGGGARYYTATWWQETTMPVYEDVEIRTDVIGEGSAIELEVNSDQQEAITFLAASRAQVMGTVSSEWVLPSTINAQNVQAQLQTRIGSAPIQGLMFDNAIVFLQGNRRKVREYFYNADQESFRSPDLTFLADHILGPGAEEFDYAQTPEPSLYFVRSDGVLAVLVYNKQYGTQAWCRFISGDAIESVAVIPGAEGDDIYLAVRRGASRRIERLAQCFSGYHVDSGAILEKNIAKYIDENTVLWNGSTVTGLSWLSGSVSMVNNGIAYTGTVTGGELPLPAGITSGTLYIGLPFVATGRTLRLTTQGRFGLAQGYYKRIIQAVFRLLNSNPFQAGRGTTFETTEITGPFTGDVNVPLNSGWETEGWLTFKQDQPLPVTILGIIAEIEN